MRRGGPRRAAIMLASVFAFLSLLFVWQRGLQGELDSFIPLLLTGAMMAVIGYFQTKRMAKATALLSSLSAELSHEGLTIDSSAGRHVVKLSELGRVFLFRSWLSKKVAYVGLELSGRLALVPPLQDNAAFAKELENAAPHATQVEKRKLLLYAGL